MIPGMSAAERLYKDA